MSRRNNNKQPRGPYLQFEIVLMSITVQCFKLSGFHHNKSLNHNNNMDVELASTVSKKRNARSS